MSGAVSLAKRFDGTRDSREEGFPLTEQRCHEAPDLFKTANMMNVRTSIGERFIIPGPSPQFDPPICIHAKLASHVSL